MKVQCTLIMRTFRGMVVVSRWIPALSKSIGQTQPITFHPTSAFDPINPNTFPYSTSALEWTKQVLKRMVDGGSEYNFVDERQSGKNVPSVDAQLVIEGSSEHGHDEGSRAFPNCPRPRPQEVPWQKEIANTVHLIGVLGWPVTLAHAKSGCAYVRNVLAVENSDKDEPMRFNLMFWNQLAEAAAQHLKQNDRVYVSGRLTSSTLVRENDKSCIFYKVTVNTLNLIPRKSPGFSQEVVVNTNARCLAVSKQVVANENTSSPVVSQSTVRNGVTPFQYQQSPIKSSSSGTKSLFPGKKTGETATTTERLWAAFFAYPGDWWDTRRRKKNNPKFPDFKHKVTGEALWIESTSSPSWVRSQVAVWDSRMKGLEEWRGG